MFWSCSKIVKKIEDLTEEVKSTNRSITQLKDLLEDFLSRPEVPGPLRIFNLREEIGENGMADVIVFDVALPTLADTHDVASRELTVTVDGTTDVVSVGPTDTVITDRRANQGSAVSLELRDVDDGGNRSEPSVFDFTATDTVPPPVPGELGIQNLREEHTP